jgi:hypothetical protein
VPCLLGQQVANIDSNRASRWPVPGGSGRPSARWRRASAEVRASLVDAQHLFVTAQRHLVPALGGQRIARSSRGRSTG